MKIRKYLKNSILALAAVISVPMAGLTAPADISTWIVDWDLPAGLSEYKNNRDVFSSIQLFAAYFDKDDNIYVHETLKEWLPKAQFWTKNVGNPSMLLTIVNDRIAEEDKITIKDPELVSRLLKDENSKKAHMNQIMELASNPMFIGIEIDYERVKKEDWPAFLNFCKELRDQMAQSGKKLRVVLEPKKEYYQTPLPGGIEYVIMAYNLHGGHNEPGPKANRQFINDLFDLSHSVTSTPPRLAFANGGFIWQHDGTVKSLTERDALALAKKHDIKPEVDQESRAMKFTFPAEKTSKSKKDYNEVWFASGETIAYWIELSKTAGFKDFAIWRLGGNDPSSLEEMALKILK